MSKLDAQRFEDPYKDAYKQTIYSGCVIESNGVSICDLRYFVPFYRNKEKPIYQVTCDNSNEESSKLYGNIIEALNAFIELKSIKR